MDKLVRPSQHETLGKIVNVIKENPLTIAELSRKTNINRSTLAYYLKILKDNKVIKTKRIEKRERGRPTKIIYTPEEESKKFFLDLREKDKKFTLKHKEDLIKILTLIKENDGIERKELMEKVAKDFSFSQTAVLHLNTLYWRDLTSEKVSITPLGEKFLKENA